MDVQPIASTAPDADPVPAAPAAGANEENLSVAELCIEIQRLTELERRTERDLCRHLAELADRFDRRDRELSAYADIYQFAEVRFGMSMRRVRERVRVGRALRRLPTVERAFANGELGYAKVREVTRVAEPETEAQWVATAAELPLRSLEHRIAEVTGGSKARRPDPCDAPVNTHWATPKKIEMRAILPAEAWALLERAMEGARRASESPLTDAEALEAVARDALARQASTDPADVRNMVVTYTCKRCERSEVLTGRSIVDLPQETAEKIACGAKHVDLEKEGRAVTSEGELPASVRRAVMLRDRMTCRAPGCIGRRYIEVHHIKARALGGEHSRKNCIVLCTRCHDRLHDGRLRMEGDGDGEVRFFDADANPLDAETTPGGPGAEFFSPHHAIVLDALKHRPHCYEEDLTELTGLSDADISVALLELTLTDRVLQDGRTLSYSLKRKGPLH